MTFEDLLDIQQFLSTPSARRATYNIKKVIGAH